MALAPEDIHRISRLARLAVTDQEVTQVTLQINGILDFVAQLAAADTGQATAMSHAVASSQRLREDCVSEANRREALQAIAPDVENGLYLVPKVIE